MQQSRYRAYSAVLSAIFLISSPAWGNQCEPVTTTAMRAIGLVCDTTDCSDYQIDLKELLGASNKNNTSITSVLEALGKHPAAINTALLREAVNDALATTTDPVLLKTAQKILSLCDKQAENIYEPAVITNVPTITRAAADQWVVKKTTAGNTVTFDPATGNIKINQDLQTGASVVFNSLTSTGAALTLDAAASNVINMGNTNATAVNIATAGTAATAVSIGTTSTVTDINIGASATTSTIDITGVATVVTGSTSARLDAPTVNVGNILATDVNVGSATATTTDLTGVTTTVTGSTAASIDGTTVNLGNTTATTLNMGTTASTDINIGRAGTTTLDILGTTLNVTGTTTAVTGSTSASIDGATVNLGNTTATTLNMGVTASTDINIGRAGTTTLDILGTTLNVTGTTTAVTGSTSARLDGATVNIGNTMATDINIGSGSTTTIDVVGTNLNVTGTANMLAGNEILFWNGAFKSGIKAGSLTGNTTTLQLPITNGSSGQVLVTDGSGVLSWASAATNLNRVDAYRATTDQTTAAATETIIFNTAPINPGTAYNTTTGEYTVPATGIYAINAQICMQPVDTGTKQIDLAIGGVAQTGYQSKIVVPTLVSSGSPAIYETYMVNLYCLISLTATTDVVSISYTGTTGDIILKNASHLSAHLIST